VELKLFMAMHDKVLHAYKTNCKNCMKRMNFQFMHYNYMNGDGLQVNKKVGDIINDSKQVKIQYTQNN
jgi:hypothetical protein